MTAALLLSLIASVTNVTEPCSAPLLEAWIEKEELKYTISCDVDTIVFAAPTQRQTKYPETLPPPLPSGTREFTNPSPYTGNHPLTNVGTNTVVEGLRPWHPIPIPSEVYRQWRYKISVPAGFVGFIANQVVQRHQSVQIYQGSFRDRYIPIFLAQSLEVSHFDNITFIKHPAVKSQPFSLGESLEQDVHELIDFIKREGPEGDDAPSTLFVLGHRGESIAFDFPSGVFLHERLFEAKNNWISWFPQRQLSVLRSYLRYRLTQIKRPTLHSAQERQWIEWETEAFLQDRVSREEVVGTDTLTDIAVIPEIDQFLTDPQVPFSGAVGRFQNGSRRGNQSTPWGWNRTYVDGDWLRLLMQASGLELSKTAHGCTALSPEAQPLCLGWQRRPLPSIDLELEIQESKDGAYRLSVSSRPTDATPLLPEEIRVKLGDGSHVGIAPNSSIAISSKQLPAQISSEAKVFEQPSVSNPFPHYNNQSNNPWRWMLNSIFGLVGGSGGNFTVAAQFAGRPLYASSPRLYPTLVVGSSYLSTGFASSWNFGPYSQALSREHNVGLGVIGSLTKDEASQWLPALSGWTGYRWSTRISQWDFLSGHGFSARLTGGLSNGDQLAPFLAIGSGLLSVNRLSKDTALAARVRYNRVTGQEKNTLGFPLGSRDRGVRGIGLGLYTVPERWLGTLELRGVLGRGYQDLFGLVGLTQLRGTLFSDFAWIPDRGTANNCPGVVGSAGIGLQWVGDVVGVAPGALTLDLGFPVRGCDETVFEVYIGFVPPLLAF